MTQAIQILFGGLQQGCIFALIALGFTLVYRVTRVVNLAQGAFCIAGTMIYYTLHVSLGWPMLAAIPVAVLLTVVLGLVLGAATFVPSLDRLPNSSMLMLTAGLLTLVEGAILVIWGSQPYALEPFSGVESTSIGGIRIATQGIWIVGIVALAIVLLWLVLSYTTMGKALRACAENPTAARLMGINVRLVTLLTFGVAAALGALGGIAVAPLVSFQFDTGHFFTISGFIAVAIGGIGSFAGAIAGGLLLGVSEQLAAAYISSLFANALALGLLIIVLAWRPSGLFNAGPARRQDVREEVRAHRAIVRFKGRTPVIAGTAVLILLAVLPQLVDDGMLSSLVITGILAIAVLGLDVLMGFAGQASLGQAAFMAIGGYTAAILSVRYDVSPLLGTFGGILLSSICAVGLSLLTMRLRGFYLALATLAFGLLVDSLTVSMSDVTGGPSGLVGIPSFSVGSLSFDTPISMYYLVLVLLSLLVVMLLGGLRGRFGRALQAIRTDQLAAAALGINVPRHKMAAFIISAGLGSLAGSLYAFFFHFLSPDMVSTTRSLEMVAMLVIGGEGTLVGLLLGTGLLTLLPEVFQPFALYKTFATGLLLILTFQYLPDGLFGTLVSVLSRRRSGLSQARMARKMGTGVAK